jgi:general secretion pathway protein E
MAPFAHDATLSDRLLAVGAVEPAALARATAAATREGTRLEEMLLRLGLIEEAQLLPALCHVIGVPTAGEHDLTPDPVAVTTLTEAYLHANRVLPVQTADGTPALLMADPGNTALRDEVAFLLGAPRPVIGATTAAVRAMTAPGTVATDATDRSAIARDAEMLRRTAVDGPVIKFVQEVLADAITAGASDMHYESSETGLDLRFRINGVLVPRRVDRDLNPAAILSRLKVMAGVNVAERRLPQDGRMEATIAGRKIDFRFSSLPTQWGESIVARVLDPKALRLGWDRLGFEASLVAQVKGILARPSGLFLVTGPTGSGKTTTLYTAIAHLNTTGRKIVTVEDPVEYNLPGVQQVQVQEDIGLTFARVLRGVLRHDPNVILIGEIRDAETAEIAARAAQVGRLVLSTLHTNAASGAVTRLVDLGVPAFLVRDVLHGVLGQELQLVPCAACQGAGCAVCGGTGFGARRLVAELWVGEN